MKWFYNLKISRKLITGFSVVIAMTIILSVLTLTKLETLRTMQNEGAVRSSTALNADHARRLPYKMYQVIADAEINRDIPATEKKWNELKKEIDGVFNDLKKDADTDSEKVWVNESQNEINKIISVFEGDMITLLKAERTDENDIVIRNIDERIDELMTRAQPPLRSYSESLIREMNQADLEYDSTAGQIESLSIIISIIVVVVSFVLALFIAKIISAPIQRVVHMIFEMGKAHFGERLRIETQDEIGELARAMDKFSDDLQKSVVGVVHKISEGDTTVRVNVSDDKDEIAPALNRLVETLKELVLESNMLTQAAVEGKLSTRGNISKFNGGFREIVNGVNDTLDAVVKPIQEGSKVLEVMATGDFTPRVVGEYSGDHQIIKNSINKLGESVTRILTDVTEAVQAAASASNQISSSTEEMAAGAQEQTSQTTEVASAVEEMTRTILDTTKNSAAAAESARHAGAIAREGGKVVNLTIEGMNKVAEVVRDSATMVQALGKSSNQIGEIVQVIDDIADQTNLLALNAAIEAARAGEQGRGFAVVADEVRKLAERTTKATKEIAVMIRQIQKDTEGAVVSMNQGTVEVEKGKDLADKAGKALTEIISGSQEVVDMVAQVAAASEEQSATAEQISKNIEGINNVTQESAQGVQQIAHASEDLNRLTMNLQELISRFKIDENDINKGFKPLNKNAMKLSH